MPRRNAPATLPFEANLARRIAWERELRGWSYDSLAQRMTDRGYPIHGSAIYKIEKGDPPRRVTVNELAAFALAFGMNAWELTVHPERVHDPELTQLIYRVEASLRDLNAAVGDVERVVTQEPERQAGLAAILKHDYSDWPELRALLAAARRGEPKYSLQPQPQSRHTERDS